MHSVFTRDPVHLLRERERIDAVKKLEERQRVPDFVLLQMTNEMPSQAGREQRNFRARLLHPTFAKQSLTGLVRLVYFLGVVSFGNRHELDIVRRAAFFFSCIGNLRSHMLQVLRNFLHAERFHCWNRAARILLSEARTPAFLEWIRAQLHHYLLVNRSAIGQNMLLMKRCLFLLGFIVAAICSSLSAQTVLSILQENTGKTVELHLQAGDKIGGKVEQVNENVVHLSHLTGAEFFDAFVNVNDISAVVIRTGGK